MKNRFVRTRIIFILPLLLIAFQELSAQSTSPVHRWQKKSRYEISAPEEQSFRDLPEIDYAPDQNINEWSSAKELKQFAATQTAKRVVVRTILKIDEKGVIQSVKILSASNKTAADQLALLLKNTKVTGPAYIHNKAVTAYVPCFFTITNKEISTL